MQIIETASLTPDKLADLDFNTQYQIYNGFDTLLTHELAGKIEPPPNTHEAHLYRFERALMPVALAMSKRGVAVDINARTEALKSLTERAEAMHDLANTVAKVLWGSEINVRSHVQLKKLFYDALGIPKQYKREKGETKVSTDYNALERIARDYVRGRMMAKIVLRIRDIEKLKSTLETRLTADNRWHASFNVAGTDTTRFSSGDDAFGYGANLQNITEELRRIFVPDEGKILAYTDLKGAESMFVAYMCGDENYIRAANSGDSHTLIASKLFGIPENKEEAEKEYSHGRSYRDISKASQHASNYGGTPFAIAMQKNVPVRLVEEFQKGYFKEYPGIRAWQEATIEELQTTGAVITPTGVRRIFWDRLRDDDIIKKALAFKPQAGIAHVMNMGMVRVHYGAPEVQLLAQVHDAIVFQLPEDRVDEIMPKVIDLLEIPLAITDIKGVTRVMKIPVEANIGYNWSKVDPKKKLFKDGNPLGMREWKSGTVIDKTVALAA